MEGGKACRPYDDTCYRKGFINKQIMEIALIENIQREDLNPIEEAEAYHRLLNEI